MTTSGKNANRGTAGGSRIFLIWSPTQTNPANLANITGHSLPSSTFDANIICVCRFIITIALVHLYQVLFDNVLLVPKDCHSLEKGPATKLDEFLEKFQTAFDPLPHLWKLCCNFFYYGYGCIYARRYEVKIEWNAGSCLLQSGSCFDYSQYNCWKNIPWTLNLLFLYQIHAQKALFKVPKICNINFWIENDPPTPLFGPFPKIHPIW